jgi:hypothetical protein
MLFFVCSSFETTNERFDKRSRGFFKKNYFSGRNGAYENGLSIFSVFLFQVDVSLASELSVESTSFSDLAIFVYKMELFFSENFKFL